MATVEVRAVSEREQQAVIDVITLAFSTDPMARWAYPDAATKTVCELTRRRCV